MYPIALTGGIAEGKTTVLQMFQQLGAYTISSDALVAELVRPGKDLWNRLIAEFGQGIVRTDGTLIREHLAQMAFGDHAIRRKLNQIMHPAVVQAIGERLKHVQAPKVIIEVPLLIEVAMQGLFDGIIVVHATPSVQCRRLLERGLSATMARRRLRSQLPTRAKIPFADWVIRTHGSLEQTYAQVKQVWQILTS